MHTESLETCYGECIEIQNLKIYVFLINKREETVHNQAIKLFSWEYVFLNYTKMKPLKYFNYISVIMKETKERLVSLSLKLSNHNDSHFV